MTRILVVDDEQEVCDLLDEFLTKKGYEVFTALSGEEAISRVREKKPHVILLDIKMPNMSGMEVLRQVKEIDEKIGIIMITAVTGMETIKKALKMGVNDYITKPFDLEYLEKLLIGWRQVFMPDSLE